jgi:hypothetical protein
MKPSSRNDVLQLQSRLQTPHQLAEAAGGYAKTEWNFERVVAMPRSDRAKHRIVVVGRDGNEPPLFLFRETDGRVVEWTQSQVDEYLRVAWKQDWVLD